MSKGLHHAKILSYEAGWWNPVSAISHHNIMCTLSCFHWILFLLLNLFAINTNSQSTIHFKWDCIVQYHLLLLRFFFLTFSPFWSKWHKFTVCGIFVRCEKDSLIVVLITLAAALISFINFAASGAVPPVHKKMRGVNDPFLNRDMQVLYWFFFCFLDVCTFQGLSSSCQSGPKGL